MSKTNVRIGAFEIDDAELHGEHQGERTLSIPANPIQIYVCSLTPGMPTPAFPRFSMVSIPSSTVNITTASPMPGSCALPDANEPVA